MEHNGNKHSLEPADVDASPTTSDGGGVESHAPPTQITSIDGFFNRKRGRPPKNRFVEVYKSAQHSPQAIFTSFKLEKSDQTSGLAATHGETVETSLSSLRLAAVAAQTTPSPLLATDLPPNRHRKRARPWPTEAQKEMILTSGNEKTKQSILLESGETRSPTQLMFTTPTIDSDGSPKCVERVSVVRASGTFYPENASTATLVEPTESTRERPCSPVDRAEQPEDLSMRGAPTVVGASRAEPETGLKLLQFKQLIDLYQRQVLLPSFLAAASQPAALDMRVLFENAAQQKMLLINAAAAASAVAAAAAVATANVTDEPKPLEDAPAMLQTAAPMQARGKRVRDQDIPTGYLKFRFNEDCGFERCGYRNHQSHFHCNRRDCHYSFCDKTRFVQHTARHDRMDTLMGDDFRQYRANMRCGVTDCCYATPNGPDDILAMATAPKKSSHFHCRKCDYVCTDSNKVVAHRRLHMRLEYVRSAGFRKIASNESCASPACSYALRHTHYHCTTCDCSVLSRAQLASHRHRISQGTKLEELTAPEQDLRTLP